ncbi:putative B3 domain-containing protein Os03g0621600 [Trifolium pratense]|uniref:putative B3 domain-containing protein Os03g0621600 n=1 Tax=Trifolium pratense TaxID=57577 RepID=UPI001E696E14|nr:putative B3 domain-containing protein Os03g0621600 [Trifolium pratense]
MAMMANESPHVKPTHFFKIICDQNLLEGKLMMPRKFVQKYGEGLTKIIYLKTPNGAKWKLNLVKSDGKIWFEKGWKEFVEYHSLVHGHLIVFKYERNSHFEVQIFDKNACEIKYPFKRFDGKRVFNGQKKKANLSLEFHQPCEIGSSSGVRVGKLPKVETLNHIDKKCKGKQLVIAKKVTALDRAISFRTCNPSFHVVMCPSYIDGPCNLNIPKEFGKIHLSDLDNKQGDIHLRLLNGRVWPLRYLIRIYNRRGLKYEMRSKGWKTFAEDNNLKVGDVCKFELLPTNTIVTFTVHIFKD